MNCAPGSDDKKELSENGRRTNLFAQFVWDICCNSAPFAVALVNTRLKDIIYM